MLPAAPVVYCRAGEKTKELVERLGAQGMELSFIEGGVLGWEASGFSLERPD
jgi:thioredoxin 1/putative thioredoxin